MGSYFKPLRRKIGIVSLILSCMLMVEWLRSFSFRDFYCFASKMSVSKIVSFDSHLGIEIRNGSLPNYVSGYRFGEPWRLRTKSLTQWVTSKGGSYRLGFGNVFQKNEDPDLIAVYAHYGWMLMPPIILSAWLLLSKPRAKPKN